MCARPAYDAVVVRFGPEIGVKSRPVRLRYERLITKHVRKALRRREIPYGSIEYEFGRLFVFTSRPVEAAEAISRVFGVSSTSPA
ncbi:MAG TPA: tRNA 4-thiouridine(8) synthase ThiI, partial [Candidatus Bathyarchaeota archaeon]|nr:tRNA 4-thiouridine(8) synthase ThiI [Candidatus Bathyarchaeota archaeon]